MKRLISVIGIMFLVGGVALPAMAHSPGSGRGGHMMGSWQGGAQDCPGYGGTTGSLTKEQQTELERLHQKFFDETSTAKNELWNKRGELNILLNTSNPDTEKAKALQKEISDLKSKLAQKRLDFKLERKKIAPDQRYGRGYGGRGMGYGSHMMGGSGRNMMGGYGGHMSGGYGGHMMGGYGGNMMGGYGPQKGYGGHMGYGRSMGGYQMGGYGPGSCRN